MTKKQDQLEKEYTSVRKQIVEKVDEAVRLLKEANKLVSKANIRGSFGSGDDDYLPYHNKAENLYDLSLGEYVEDYMEDENGDEIKLKLSPADKTAYKKLAKSVNKLYEFCWLADVFYWVLT